MLLRLRRLFISFAMRRQCLRYTRDVKTLELTDVGRLADELKSGEIIEIRDGDAIVAQVTPLRRQTLEERLEELAAQGKVKKGTGTLPDWLLEERPPKFKGSVLEQLLKDRESDW
jgi:antitoxin (DNA-binding transcriptional repressor) of toxin-antitoxin stability system